MKFIAPLSEAEHTTLNEAYHAHPSFRVRQRAQALLLNARGYCMAEISEWLDVQHETVSRWLKHWEAEGLVGLLDAPRSGRPPLLSEAEVDQFIGYIDENPGGAGTDCPCVFPSSSVISMKIPISSRQRWLVCRKKPVKRPVWIPSNGC